MADCFAVEDFSIGANRQTASAVAEFICKGRKEQNP